MTISCLNSQIRLMMSAAFMSTLGVLPEHFIEVSIFPSRTTETLQDVNHAVDLDRSLAALLLSPAPGSC